MHSVLLITTLLNDCYNEVTAYTALADLYWASFSRSVWILRSRPLTISTTADIKTIQLIEPIIWCLYHTISRYWYLIASGADTHIHIATDNHGQVHNQVRAWFKSY